MLGRLLLTVAVGASCLAVAPSARAGGGPQVTVYMGGYGQPARGPAAQPVASVPPSAPSPSLVQAEVTIAELAAYNRYLQYVALTSSGATRPTQAEMAQYFSNGAAATTIPSSTGKLGLRTTRMARRRRGCQPRPRRSRPATEPCVPGEPAARRGSTRAVLVGRRDDARTEPRAVPRSSPPPPPPAPEPEARPVEAMSFEEWLQSMGAEVQEAPSRSIPSLASAEVETAPIAEPSSTVVEVRQRVSSLVREKRARSRRRGHGFGRKGGRADRNVRRGLLLGALVMMRPRFRFHAE